MTAFEKWDFERIEKLEKDRKDAMRFLAILVERLGGQVEIHPNELVADRYLERDDHKLTGAVILRAKKP